MMQERLERILKALEAGNSDKVDAEDIEVLTEWGFALLRVVKVSSPPFTFLDPHTNAYQLGWLAAMRMVRDNYHNSIEPYAH